MSSLPQPSSPQPCSWSSAVRQDRAATPTSSDSKTFEFWSFTGINQKAAVDVYTKAHPDIQIKLTEVGSTTETAQALTAALAGGKVPDLVLIQGDDLPKFMQSPDNFVDLTTLGADKMKGDYLDWVMKQSITKDGKIIGIPTDVGGWRSRTARTCSRPPVCPPIGTRCPSCGRPGTRSWTAGKKYVQATGKPFLDNTSTSVFFQAVNQGTERYYDADRKLSYDKNPQVKAAFDLALKIHASGITSKITSWSTGWTAGMSKGDFAVMSAPSWMLNAIRTNAPDTAGKWDVAAIPGGSGNWGGSYLAIPKRAKNPKAAWNYIAEMQSPAGQLDALPVAGGIADDTVGLFGPASSSRRPTRSSPTHRSARSTPSPCWGSSRSTSDQTTPPSASS